MAGAPDARPACTTLAKGVSIQNLTDAPYRERGQVTAIDITRAEAQVGDICAEQKLDLRKNALVLEYAGITRVGLIYGKDS